MNDWWDPFFIAVLGVLFFLTILWIYVAYMLPLSVEAGITIGAHL